MNDQQQSRPDAREQIHDKRVLVEHDAAPAFDANRYRHHLERMNLTRAQEDDVIAALQWLLGNFIDRAFGEDSVQLARISGDDGIAVREVHASIALDSTQPPNKNNNRLADLFGNSGKGE